MIMCSEDIKEFKIELTVNDYKKQMNNNINQKQIDFVTSLVHGFYEDDRYGAYVNTNRCGMGKSTTIRAFLKNLVNNYLHFGEVSREDELDYFGAIVIHDSIDGLKKIAEYDGLEDRCYFMGHNSEDDSMLRVDLIKKNEYELANQQQYPIVLITTQKYFKLTESERELLYTWKRGKEKYKREIKIIDEKPYILKHITIDHEYLHEIKSALEKLPNDADKKYIMDAWKELEEGLDKIRDNYMEKYELMWIKKNERSLLVNKDEDDRFFKLLNGKITNDIYNKIITIERIYSEGCLFIANKAEHQDNVRKFILPTSNIDKLDLDKCKCFILDASALHDIEYRVDEKSFIFDEKYTSDDKKEKKDIIVHHIAVNTSQNALANNHKNIEAICKWGNETFGDEAFVATYSDKESKDKKFFSMFSKGLNANDIEYFQNIKGKNTWESKTVMCQIGLNRKSHHLYLAHYIVMKNKGEEWNNMSDEDIELDIKAIIEPERIDGLKNGEPISKGTFKDKLMTDIMFSDIITDTIQNVMRIKCRHFTNTDMCQIFIVCSGSYHTIVSKVRDAIGGYLMTAYKPPIFIEAKTDSRKPAEGKENTNPQIVMKYIKSIETGTIIKMKDIIDATGLNSKQINKVKDNNRWMKDWFKNHKVEGKSQYIA